MSDLVFPDGFLWGVSTSSYQIEGGNIHSDWRAWEDEGRVPDRCGLATDSWSRFREDVDLAADLGLNTYRISTEWSRIEPQPGVFDETAIAHYAEWLAYAKSRGLSTMLVLWHFTNPTWLTERGAWTWSEAPAMFEQFVQKAAPILGPHVDWWATLNEANTYANHGWLTGAWPPGRRNDYPGGFRAYAGLAEGHIRARRAIKAILGESTPVGLTHVIPWAHPAVGRHRALVAGSLLYWNWLGWTNFLDRVRTQLDWLGVQYYSDTPCTPFGYDLDGCELPRTDMGWRICPEGLYHVVMAAWERYRIPILVTENGLADAADTQRGRFIIDHLAWLHRAIAQGADVRGYLHWSLLDNYEWAYGYPPRFGLVEVDYETRQRTPRSSANLYAQIARDNRIEHGLGAGLAYLDGSPTLAPR